MRETPILTICVLLIAAFGFGSAFARSGKAVCEANIQGYDDIHCTYLQGLEREIDGRYIKHQDLNAGFSYTTCVYGNEAEYDIYQEMGLEMLGNQGIEYSICADINGNHCEVLGRDELSIAQDGEKDEVPHFTAQPSTYAIDVSAVAQKYPACFSLKTQSQVLKGFKPKR